MSIKDLKCEHCGGSLNPDTLICEHCGHNHYKNDEITTTRKIERVTETETITKVEKKPIIIPKILPQKKQSKSKTKLIIGLVSFLLIILVCSGLYLNSIQTNEVIPTPTSQPTAIPTHKPTPIPTAISTPEPTVTPTASPIPTPTPIPTGVVLPELASSITMLNTSGLIPINIGVCYESCYSSDFPLTSFFRTQYDLTYGASYLFPFIVVQCNFSPCDYSISANNYPSMMSGMSYNGAIGFDKLDGNMKTYGYAENIPIIGTTYTIIVTNSNSREIIGNISFIVNYIPTPIKISSP